MWGVFLSALLFLSFSFFSVEYWATLFSLAYLVACWIAILLYREKWDMDYFAPIFPTLGLLYLYVIASGLNAGSHGVTIYGDIVEPEILKTYYLSCFIGTIGLCVGFISGIKAGKFDGKLSRVLRRVWAISAYKLLTYGLIFFVVGFPYSTKPFDFLHAKSYSEYAFASRLASMENASTPLIEVFGVYPSMVCLLSGATILLFNAKRSISRVLSITILFSFFATAILSGSRSYAVLPAILILFYYHYRIRKIGVKLLAATVMFSYLVVNALPVLRVTNSPVEMAQIFVSTLMERRELLSVENSGEFLVSQNFMRLISGVAVGETAYSYGETFVSEVLTYIPRVLFSDRPLPLSEKFVETFYPGVRDTGAGYGFFYLMDGYWAFGFLGVYIVMMFYAKVVQHMYQLCDPFSGSDASAMFYVFLLFATVFTAIRGGVIGSFKFALMLSTPFLVTSILPTIKIWDNRSGFH